MTEDNAKSKLTLSGKSTLTLKNVGEVAKAHNNDGKKVVQVEVRKKRIIANRSENEEQKVKIDEATAAKLRLIAEAKEHDAKRKLEEEEKERQRLLRKEQEEKEKAQLEAKQISSNPNRDVEGKNVSELQNVMESAPVKSEDDYKERNVKTKEKKFRDFDYDDTDDDADDDFHNHKFKKSQDKSLSKDDVFEQERKKITKRSFETPRRGGKVNLHNYGNVDDEDDDYGFGGGVRRRFKKKQPKQQVNQQPTEKIIKEVIIPEIITVQELANRMAEKKC